MHQLLKHDVTAGANQPGLLAPDTTGLNFYRADPALTDLLRIHLPDVLFRHIEPLLDRLGQLAGAISTTARGSRTAMSLCSISATDSAATCSGSNIIRP